MATQMLDPKQMIIDKMAETEPFYNAEIRLLKSRFSSPGYHTQIKQAEYIHSTRNSVVYALALLDTELPDYERRAFDILGTIVSLQDVDRSRSTFGIWSWFYEEPLDRMAPPDWNWADFIGKQLVLAIKRHGHRFPEALYASVVRSIGFACDAIIKRDVGPSYTNIAIMGAFVTLIAGELLGREEYEEYGLQRLKKLYAHTEKRLVFQEYNSPTYTHIAILELSKIRAETVNEEAKRLSDDLLRMTWKTVAEHFHAATKQWSGPHSRCYSTLLSGQCKAFLQLSTGGKLFFFPWEELPYDTEWYKSGMVCPPDFADWFAAGEERELRQLYAGDEADGTARWATTWMQPHYSLGSFDHEVMWNQKRALLAYVDNGGEAAYMQLRFLHDGYDYCSAVFKSRQRRENVLFGIDFLANGGDTHPGLDRIYGSIAASDFRLRLELGGNLAGAAADADSDGGGVTISIGRERVRLQTWFAAFSEAGAYAVTDAGADVVADAVAYAVTDAGADVVADAVAYAVTDAGAEAGVGVDGKSGLSAGEGADAEASVKAEERTDVASYAHSEAEQAPAFKWEINELGDKLGVDLVVYSGEPRTIDFRRIAEAGFVFTLCIGSWEDLPAPSLRRSADRLTVSGSGQQEEAFSLNLRPVEI